jgi:hypothetical protein
MHLPTIRAPALARNPSCRRRSSGGLVLACLILATCAVTGSPLSALEGDQKPAPKKGLAKTPVTGVKPTAAPVAGAKSTTAPAGAVAAVPDPVQRRRRAIAEMLEGNLYFRGVVDDGAPKLVEPKFAGPFDVTQRTGLFSSTTVTETLYCVSSGVKWSFVPTVYRTAVIRVVKVAEGERLQAKIGVNYPPFECNRAPYTPYPEIEQLRTQRRRALGKTD